MPYIEVGLHCGHSWHARAHRIWVELEGLDGTIAGGRTGSGIKNSDIFSRCFLSRVTSLSCAKRDWDTLVRRTRMNSL